MASVIKNFDTVEQVIATSQNSAGSALRENEVYLDSIQGKMDQLSNSTQTMWMNFMRSDVVKFLVSLATGFVQVTDKVGLLNVAVSAFLAKIAFNAKSGSLRWSQYLFPSLDQYIVKAHAAAAANQTLGLGAQAAAVGVKLLNAALTMGAGLLIGLAINAVISSFYDLAYASEKVAEAANKAKESIASISSEFKTKQQTVSELSKRFAELAQGVDAVSGKNISLRTDDYKEFLDISNKLADIFPTLSRHYDENGNAIVRLSGDTNTIVGSLENLLEVQRQLANQKIVDNIPDLYKGIRQESKQNKEDLETLKSERDTYQQTLDLIKDINNEQSFDKLFDGNILRVTGDDPETIQKIADQYLSILENLGLETEQLTSDLNNEGQIIGLNYQIVDFNNMSDEELERAKQKIKIGVSELVQTYSDEISNLNTQIQNTENKNKANWSSLLSSIFSWLQTDSSYRVLSDDMKSVVQTVINNTDFSKLNFESWEVLQDYIQSSILPIFTDPTLSQNISSAITKMFDIQSKFNSNKISLQGYKDQVLSFIDTIQTSGLNETVQEQLLQMFNIDVDKLKENEGTISKSVDATLNYIQEYLTDEAKGRVLELTYSDLQIINSDKFKVPAGTLLTWDQLQTQIKETKKLMTQDFTSSNFADYTDNIKTISSNVSTLQTALNSLESGTFTLADFIELTSKFPELAKGVDVSSKSFDGLAKNLRKAIRNSPKDLIEDLEDLRKQLEEAGKSTTVIDQLISGISDMPTDTVSNLADVYGTLADNMNAARVAQTALQEAMKENPDEGYEARAKALEEMIKLMSNGEIGSASPLWNIAKEFGFVYDQTQDLYANADKLYQFIEKRYAWYATDKSGNYTSAGIEQFIKDVAAKKDILAQFGATWEYTNGQFKFDLDNKYWDEFAEALGLCSEEFSDLMQRAAQFADIQWTDDNDRVDDFIKSKAEQNAKFEELYKNGQIEGKLTISEQEIGQYFDVTGEKLTSLIEAFKSKYGEFLNIINDPLNISSAVDQGGLDGLLKITEIQDAIKANSDGTTLIDEDAFKSALQDAGYTEDAINSLLDKIAELNQVTLFKDSLGIESALKNGIEGLKQIKEIKDSLTTDANTGLTIFNVDIFSSILEQAGYTQTQIDGLIERIKTYKEIVAVSDADPLGLNSMNASINTLKASLTVLGVEFDSLNDKELKIQAEELVTALQKKGWTPEAIKAYGQQVSDSAQIKVQGIENIDDIIEKAGTSQEPNTVTVNLEGNAQEGVSQIKSDVNELTSNGPYPIVLNADGSALTSISQIQDYLNGLMGNHDPIVLNLTGVDPNSISQMKTDLEGLDSQGYLINIKVSNPEVIDEVTGLTYESDETSGGLRDVTITFIPDVDSMPETGSFDDDADVDFIPKTDQVDAYNPDPKPVDAVYKIDDKAVKEYSAPPKYGKIIYTVETQNGSGMHENSNGNQNGGGTGRNFINGTAHVQGTWGATESSTSLVGELGPEMRVRGNKWELIGENGAEFTDVRKGDINK